MASRGFDEWVVGVSGTGGRAGGTADTVYGLLYFHDYDSNDYVECGEDEDSNVSQQFGQLQVSKSCSGYESTWGVTVEVGAYTMETYERLWVKLISVYN